MPEIPLNAEGHKTDAAKPAIDWAEINKRAEIGFDPFTEFGVENGAIRSANEELILKGVPITPETRLQNANLLAADALLRNSIPITKNNRQKLAALYFGEGIPMLPDPHPQFEADMRKNALVKDGQYEYIDGRREMLHPLISRSLRAGEKTQPVRFAQIEQLSKMLEGDAGEKPKEPTRSKRDGALAQLRDFSAELKPENAAASRDALKSEYNYKLSPEPGNNGTFERMEFRGGVSLDKKLQAAGAEAVAGGKDVVVAHGKHKLYVTPETNLVEKFKDIRGFDDRQARRRDLPLSVEETAEGRRLQYEGKNLKRAVQTAIEETRSMNRTLALSVNGVDLGKVTGSSTFQEMKAKYDRARKAVKEGAAGSPAADTAEASAQKSLHEEQAKEVRQMSLDHSGIDESAAVRPNHSPAEHAIVSPAFAEIKLPQQGDEDWQRIMRQMEEDNIAGKGSESAAVSHQNMEQKEAEPSLPAEPVRLGRQIDFGSDNMTIERFSHPSGFSLVRDRTGQTDAQSLLKPQYRILSDKGEAVGTFTGRLSMNGQEKVYAFPSRSMLADDLKKFETVAEQMGLRKTEPGKTMSAFAESDTAGAGELQQSQARREMIDNREAESAPGYDKRLSFFYPPAEESVSEPAGVNSGADKRKQHSSEGGNEKLPAAMAGTSAGLGFEESADVEVAKARAQEAMQNLMREEAEAAKRSFVDSKARESKGIVTGGKAASIAGGAAAVVTVLTKGAEAAGILK